MHEALKPDLKRSRLLAIMGKLAFEDLADEDQNKQPELTGWSTIGKPQFSKAATDSGS